jgi:hydroxymethylpyrimidine/phosphomethylpyrimidine kinase
MNAVPAVLTVAGNWSERWCRHSGRFKNISGARNIWFSVITSDVAQNTMGVQHVEHLPVFFVKEQLAGILSEILPEAVKTGMVALP